MEIINSMNMGQIYADIELVNEEDLILARRNVLDKDEVKRICIHALADTGCAYMAINENIQQVLQLPVVGKRRMVLANGQIMECNVVAPLEVRFGNRNSSRSAHCSAVVLPGDSEPLLGAIPMEELDLLLHMNRQELILNPNSLIPMLTLTTPPFKVRE
jgi:predicted aspartyl protease